MNEEPISDAQLELIKIRLDYCDNITHPESLKLIDETQKEIEELERIENEKQTR